MLILLVILFSCGFGKLEGKYATKCTSIEQCPSDEGYDFCDNNIGFCHCLQGYVPSSNQPCTVFNNDGSSCGWKSHIANNLVYKLWHKCPKNSECNNEGTCVCNKRFLTTQFSFRKCIPEMYDSGDSCEEDSDCETQGQKCLKRSCKECILGRFSDGHVKTCVLQYGDRCSRIFEPLSSITTKQCPDFENTVTCKDRCVCIHTDTEFFEPSLKKCIPLPTFEESCKVSKKCQNQSVNQLYCSSSGICACPNDGEFNYEIELCVSPVNGKCVSNLNCARNAYCSKLANLTCQCKSDFIEVDGKCQPGYFGKPCLSQSNITMTKLDEKTIVKQRLKCINGVYKCEYPMRQIYNPETKKCVARIGSLCNPDEEEPCTGKSVCARVDPNKTLFSCHCNKGYSPTPGSRCLLEFGASCDKSPISDEVPMEICNNYAGLVCINGTCQCPETVILFDKKFGRCFSPDGYFCGSVDLGEDTIIKCSAGSDCIEDLIGNRCQKSFTGSVMKS